MCFCDHELSGQNRKRLYYNIILCYIKKKKREGENENRNRERERERKRERDEYV